jgi:CheY-like chemotaxis protein
MNVLLVERDSEVQASLGDLLEEEGYPCTRVAEAPAAVRWLDAHPAGDVVLLGNFAVGREAGSFNDGAALLRVLDTRETFWSCHAVVVLVALPDHLPPDIVALIARRHICLLPKPFELTAFVGAVADGARALVAVPSVSTEPP